MKRQPLPISVRGQEGAPILPQYPTRARVPARAHASQPANPQQPVQQDARALDFARAQSREREMMREYRAQVPPVDLRGYLMNTLSSMQDEDVTLNPQGIGIVVDPFAGGAGGESSAPVPGSDSSSLENDVAAIAGKIAISGAIQVDPTMPVGHISIDDTRLYFDSLIMPASLDGYASGDVAIRFSEHNGLTTPTRVVKITINRFYFPHIYLDTSTVFDLFYHRSVFLTLSVVPTTNLVQTATPNMLFTFELHVASIDSNALLLEPVEPTFCLKQPITIAGDIVAQFRVRSSRGLGFIPCPIPPLQVMATRVFPPIPPTPTTFSIGGAYIGVLAPPGAIYTVPIYIRRIPGLVPDTAFIATLFAAGDEYQAGTFVAPNTFTIPFVDTGAIPFNANDRVFIFIPKNAFAMMIRFSSAQSTVTNGLFPVHS